jgi:AraC-like DNA-binding protein
MPTLVARLPDSIARARLRTALERQRQGGPAYDALLVEGWAEAHELAASGAVSLLVFEPYVGGVLDVESCVVFRDEFPAIVLLPYGDFAGERARDVLRLAELGITHLVVRSPPGEHDGDDAPLAFALHLTDALAGSVAGRVLAALEDRIPDALVPAVRYLLFAAERPLGPQQVARATYRHEKTLRDQLRAAGLPSTQKLIIWARLFHAAQLLGSGRRSVENVAGTLDFPSASALANQLGRYAGVRPGELVGRADALERLLQIFRERHAAGDWMLRSSAGPAGARQRE